MKGIASLLITLGLTTVLSANDTDWSGVGGTPRANGEHPTIALVDETIHIRLPSGEVETRCLFHNEGPACTVQMAFPEEGLDRRAPRQSGFGYFRSWVDGRALGVRRIGPLREEEGDEWRCWWVKRVHFGAGQSRTVVNRYRSGRSDHILRGSQAFRYILTTGRTWRGPIGRVRVLVELPSPPSYLIWAAPEGAHCRNGRASWTFRDFEPDDDINLCWGPLAHCLCIGPDQRRVGERAWGLLQPGRRWQDLVRIAHGSVVLPVRVLAQMLPADIHVTPGPGRTIGVSLQRGGHRVLVTEGSPWIMANGASRLLPVPPRRQDGRLLVPLRPVAEALGCRVRQVSACPFEIDVEPAPEAP